MDENGKALYFDCYPPDMKLPNVIIDYCRKAAEPTGTVFFVVDREIDAAAITAAFEADGWGLLCMLDKKKEMIDEQVAKVNTMIFRTLFLENALVNFLSALLVRMDIFVSPKCLLELFFNRTEGKSESVYEIGYWMDSDGLSKSNKLKLEKIAEGCCKMNMHRNGKPVRVKIRPLPR